jgi:hypothetical protein
MRPVRIIIAVVFAAAIAVTGCAAHSTAVNPPVIPVADAPAPVPVPAPKSIPSRSRRPSRRSWPTATTTPTSAGNRRLAERKAFAVHRSKQPPQGWWDRTLDLAGCFTPFG